MTNFKTQIEDIISRTEHDKEQLGKIRTKVIDKVGGNKICSLLSVVINENEKSVERLKSLLQTIKASETFLSSDQTIKQSDN